MCNHTSDRTPRTCLVMSMISDRIEGHKVLLPINHNYNKLTRPSFFLGGYHPTLKLSGIPTFTFIVSLTNRMDNI